jgi:hypothetical protein
MLLTDLLRPASSCHHNRAFLSRAVLIGATLNRTVLSRTVLFVLSLVVPFNIRLACAPLGMPVLKCPPRIALSCVVPKSTASLPPWPQDSISAQKIHMHHAAPAPVFFRGTLILACPFIEPALSRPTSFCHRCMLLILSDSGPFIIYKALRLDSCFSQNALLSQGSSQGGHPLCIPASNHGRRRVLLGRAFLVVLP